MNVTFQEKDALNALLTIELQPEDYQPRLDSELKKYRKRANIPGFRPGTAPLGMVKKMVGKALLVEEVNRMASEALNNHIRENNIDILGQPLNSEDNESSLDFENPSTFILHFDLGIAPKFDLNLTPKDKLTRYKIKIDDKAVEEEIENNQRRLGKMSEIDETATDKDSVKGILTELGDDGNPLEGGVEGKESTVLLEMIKDKKLQKKLMGLKVGDTVDVDIFKFFNDNKKVLGSTLGMPEEGLNDLNKTFRLEVTELKRFSPAEVNQDMFDAMFGKDVVKDEEEFKSKIRENLESYYASEAENHLDHMVSHLILDKHALELPDEFLKRWLVQSYEDTYNEENIDELYDQESNQLRNQLITEKIVEEFKLEITEEEINQVSIGYTAQMLRQYGMGNPDLETIRYFEDKNKEDKNYMRRIRDIAVNRKVTEQVKSMIKIVEKDINIEDFYKKIEAHNKEHNH